MAADEEMEMSRLEQLGNDLESNIDANKSTDALTAQARQSRAAASKSAGGGGGGGLSKGAIAGIVIAVLLVLGGGAAAALYFTGVFGGSDDDTAATSAPVPPAAAKSTVFSFVDGAADDTNDEPAYDLKSFSVSVPGEAGGTGAPAEARRRQRRSVADPTSFWFELEFGAFVNPGDAPLGFSGKIIQVYVDTLSGTGATFSLSGAGVTFASDSAWEFLIEIDGWGARAMFPGGDGFEVRTFGCALVDGIDGKGGGLVPIRVLFLFR